MKCDYRLQHAISGLNVRKCVCLTVCWWCLLLSLPVLPVMDAVSMHLLGQWFHPRNPLNPLQQQGNRTEQVRGKITRTKVDTQKVRRMQY